MIRLRLLAIFRVAHTCRVTAILPDEPRYVTALLQHTKYAQSTLDKAKVWDKYGSRSPIKTFHELILRECY